MGFISKPRSRTIAGNWQGPACLLLAILLLRNSCFSPAESLTTLELPRNIQSVKRDENAPRNRLSTTSEMRTDKFKRLVSALDEDPRIHRKQWEYFAIAEALGYYGVLGEGRSGLGFAVGQDPMGSYFVSRGCDVVLSDMPVGGDFQTDWATTAQHTVSVKATWKRGIVDEGTYMKHAKFVPIDMNNIQEELLQEEFDFVWSCGSMEHVGSGYEATLDFMINSMRAVKVGGVAVHTTEFKVFPGPSFESKGLNFFSDMDIEKMVSKLNALGYEVDPVDYFKGQEDIDDESPHRDHNHAWVKDVHTVHTSIVLTIRKPRAVAARH